MDLKGIFRFNIQKLIILLTIFVIPGFLLSYFIGLIMNPGGGIFLTLIHIFPWLFLLFILTPELIRFTIIAGYARGFPIEGFIWFASWFILIILLWFILTNLIYKKLKKRSSHK